MTDIIGCSHMSQGTNTSFTLDRNGKSNAALALNMGYTSVPNGVYFNSAFTISLWLYPLGVQMYSKIFDFGNGASFDNVIFNLGTTQMPNFEIFSGSQLKLQINSSSSFTANSWNFLAFSFNETSAFIYLNGAVVGNSTFSTFLPSNVTRAFNYFDKSSWPVEPFPYYTNCTLDDLRIYNRCLSSSELYNQWRL